MFVEDKAKVTSKLVAWVQQGEIQKLWVRESQTATKKSAV